MSISADIQTLEPGAVIELFELDLTSLGGDVLRFHAGTNQLNQNVVWQGNEYTRFPVEASGFDFDGTGSIPRPKLRASNALSVISALLQVYGDFLGAKVTRKRTLKKYLDAINFPGGINPTADPSAAFADDVFFIDRKTSETKEMVEFELTVSFDLAAIQLPRRQIIQNLCAWKYRSGECGYAGTNYFLADDTPTTEATQDTCGKRVSSCKARFPNEPLPFGGFPGAALIR